MIVRKSFYENKLLINIVTTTQEPSNEFSDIDLLQQYTNNIINATHNIKGIIRTKNDSIADCVKNEGIDILYGEDYLIEEINGLKFYISPFSFFQTNSICVKELYNKVKQYVLYNKTKIKTLYDLYCGTGTIGQIVSDAAENIYGIEIVEEAIEKANKNAQFNNINNIKFICYDVNQLLKKMNEDDEFNMTLPDVIILDPPREGVIEKSLKKIIEFGADRIVYVSCNPATLTRDLKVLEDIYSLDKIAICDMFPFTSHCEVISVLKLK